MNIVKNGKYKNKSFKTFLLVPYASTVNISQNTELAESTTASVGITVYTL